MQQYFMPIYTTVVGVVIGLLVAWVKSLITRKTEVKAKEDADLEALKEGVAILLKQRLESYHDKYAYAEFIPMHEWKDIDKTHTVYNKLGGNSTGDRLFNELQSKHLEG